MPLYALTLFTSAFLLFLLQPLIGKFILPWYGGAPSVWTCCMLVFQGLLLVGYAQAHLLSSRLKPKAQALVMLGLLAAALVTLPVTPSETWKPLGTEDPLWGIILLLLATVGVPFLVLSTTGPLLQAWTASTHPGKAPYLLYSVSNAGSLLALIAYPVWVETEYSRREQTLLWSLGFVLFSLLCAVCAIRLLRARKRGEPSARAPLAERETATWEPKLPRWAPAAWLLLPFCASSLLLSTTNVLCQDVAVIPFLWVLPLALYLLSFVLSFAGAGWYSRLGYGSSLLGGSLLALWLQADGVDGDLVRQLLLYSLLLFCGCMVCHGELYRLRPGAGRLTEYYLALAAGGCLGGVFVAVGAPLLFVTHAEYSWSLGAALVLLSLLCLRAQGEIGEHYWRVFAVLLFLSLLLGFLLVASWSYPLSSVPEEERSLWERIAETVALARWLYLVLALIGSVLVVHRRLLKSRTFWHLTCNGLLFGTLALFACLSVRLQGHAGAQADLRSRGFYGILTVFTHDRAAEGGIRVLRNGRITHGVQYLSPARRLETAAYYSRRSGVSHVMLCAKEGQPRRVGVVGLGVGTLAGLARKGDLIRFYELNPEVLEVAREHFSFLSHCPGNVEVALGDARLTMEREPAQAFDVLVLDAFSGDAIPVHLLTKEAFDTYLRHLAPDGMIAVHISNRFLDLEPVVAGIRKHFGLHSLSFSHFTHPENAWDFGSFWIVLSRKEEVLAHPLLQGDAYRSERALPVIPLWTDERTSLLPLLR